MYAFSIEDIDRLIGTLKNKFELKCSVHLKGGKPRIYIWAESMDHLRSLGPRGPPLGLKPCGALVKLYMCLSTCYKID